MSDEKNTLLAAAGYVVYEAQVIPDKFEILGDDMQFLNIKLQPDERVQTEPGNMSYMSDNLTAGVNCDACFNRCISFNPCIMTTYTNNSQSEAYIGLASNIPSKVIPIDTSTLPSGTMRCKSGSYMAHIGDVNLSFDLDCCTATCCFGGQGCVRQSVSGSGTAFLNAMGTIMKKNLADGETIVVDTNSIVAWESTATLGIKTAGGCCTCCFGGEGMFNTTVTGPGDVYIQSYSLQKFTAYLKSVAPAGGGAAGAAGAAAGGAPAVADEMDR